MFATLAKTAGAYTNNSQSGPHHPSLYSSFSFVNSCAFFELANQVFSFQPIPRSLNTSGAVLPRRRLELPIRNTARNVEVISRRSRACRTLSGRSTMSCLHLEEGTHHGHCRTDSPRFRVHQRAFY